MMAYLSVHLLPGDWGPGEQPNAVDVTTVDGEKVRYVPERTCRPTHTRERWECDVCGCVIRHGFMPESHGVGVLKYCPNCGARIMGEES